MQRYSLHRRMDPPEVRRVMRGPPPLIEPLRLFLSSVPCDTEKLVETRPPDVRASTCKPISAARETSTLPPEVPQCHRRNVLSSQIVLSTSPMRMEPPEVDTDAVPEQPFREMDPPEVLPSTGPSMWPP